jgi:hypothetical protein
MDGMTATQISAQAKIIAQVKQRLLRETKIRDTRRIRVCIEKSLLGITGNNLVAIRTSQRFPTKKE